MSSVEPGSQAVAAPEERFAMAGSARVGLSVDWWAVILVAALVALLKAGALPSIPW